MQSHRIARGQGNEICLCMYATGRLHFPLFICGHCLYSSHEHR